MDNIVKLVFQSVAQGSGFDEITNKTQKLIANTSQLGQCVQNVSKFFGTFGQLVGGVIGNLLKGSIWGAATAGIMALAEKFDILGNKAKEAVEKQKEVAAKYAESVKNQMSQIVSAYNEEISAIEKVCKSKNAELDMTQKLIEAEIRLSMQKKNASEAEVNSAIKASQNRTNAAKAANEITMGADSSDVRKKYLDKAKEEAIRYAGIAAAYSSQAGEKISEQYGKFQTEAHLELSKKRNWDENDPYGTNQESIRRLATRKLEAWKKENKDSLYDSEISINMAAMKEAENTAREIEKEIKKAEEDRDQLAKLRIIEEKKAALEIATEKKKIDDDLHRKRMEAAQKEATAAGNKVSEYKSRFNEAFDLWRDPEAAAAAVESDKKRSSDLKAFNKAVNRYGGKGKIDEYAALMRNGDEEGMQSRLEQWRKSSKFTPQVEQMVKAEAARQNETAADRALVNIEKNTANLDKKLDELLQIK